MSSESKKLVVEALISAIVQRCYDHIQTMPLVMERTECSRLHSLIESTHPSRCFDNNPFGGILGIREDIVDKNPPKLSKCTPFLLRHNWVDFVKETLSDSVGKDVLLPFNHVAFEMKISSLPVIVIIDGDFDVTWVILRWHDNNAYQWVFVPSDFHLFKFAVDQVNAACTMLEIGIADSSSVEAPRNLNKKRAKQGKPPLASFRIVDLNIKKKSRSKSTMVLDISSTRKRLHFCRAHFRHFEDGSKTRIPPHLRGDPELGIVDKLYRL